MCLALSKNGQFPTLLFWVDKKFMKKTDVSGAKDKKP